MYSCVRPSLSLQIRTATDRATNSLVGIRLDATLPRLSCNVHSSAYLLLSRLLKNGEYISGRPGTHEKKKKKKTRSRHPTSCFETRTTGMLQPSKKSCFVVLTKKKTSRWLVLSPTWRRVWLHFSLFFWGGKKTKTATGSTISHGLGIRIYKDKYRGDTRYWELARLRSPPTPSVKKRGTSILQPSDLSLYTTIK